MQRRQSITSVTSDITNEGSINLRDNSSEHDNLKEKSDSDSKLLGISSSTKNTQLSSVRQKSLFTANPIPVTKFNVAAPPFVSSTSSPASTHRLSARKDNGLLNHVFRSQLPQATTSVPHLPAIAQNIPHIPPFDSRILRSSLSASHITNPRHMYLQDDGAFLVSNAYSNPIPLSHSCSGFRGNVFDYDSAMRNFGPVVVPNGLIQIRLREGIRVDMTIDKAIRFINHRSRVIMALSNKCTTSALIHPNGRVYQYGTRVEIACYDGLKNNNYVRYAKMWYKGVSFTSKNCALTYLVDSAGTRTTSDTFSDMTKDYTMAIFLNDSRIGAELVPELMSILNESGHQVTKDGTDIFDINGFRICQTSDGLVKISRNSNKCLLRTSPANGSATLTTPVVHITASLGKTSHLFVRRGERRMHFDGSSFVVRNAGHSAGFDKNNLLNVY